MRCIVYVLVTKVIRTQKSERTALHHIKYDKDDKLAWTIEVCNSCHSQLDPRNRKIIQRHFAPRDFAQAVDKKEQSLFWKRKIDEYYKAREKARLEYS